MMKIYNNIINNYKITSNYGYRIHPITKKKKFHYGIDLISKNNDKNIYALEDGYVQKIRVGQDKKKTGYGNYIWIRYPRINLSLFHAHCSKILLKKGDKVSKGSKIAIMGKTGASTGVHLHLGMTLIGSDTWMNPYTYNYIINSVTAKSTTRDENKDQVKVLVSNLRIRENASTSSNVLGYTNINDIYDYYETKKDNNYTWYRISDNEWIANNGKYLEVYYKKGNENMNEIDSLNDTINKLKSENEKLTNKNKELEEKINNMINNTNDNKFSYKSLKNSYYKIYLNKDETIIIN